MKQKSPLPVVIHSFGLWCITNHTIIHQRESLCHSCVPPPTTIQLLLPEAFVVVTVSVRHFFTRIHTRILQTFVFAATIQPPAHYPSLSWTFSSTTSHPQSNYILTCLTVSKQIIRNDQMHRRQSSSPTATTLTPKSTEFPRTSSQSQADSSGHHIQWDNKCSRRPFNCTHNYISLTYTRPSYNSWSQSFSPISGRICLTLTRWQSLGSVWLLLSLSQSLTFNHYINLPAYLGHQ